MSRNSRKSSLFDDNSLVRGFEYDSKNYQNADGVIFCFVIGVMLFIIFTCQKKNNTTMRVHYADAIF